MVIISGDSADVALAYELVEELVAAEKVRLDLEDGLHAAQTTIRVPGSLVGGLMGQRGERIMHIERLCGAKVDLSRRLEHDTREIRISSRDAASVQRAVEMIQTAVNRRGGSEVQSQPAPVERAAAHRSAKTKLTDLAATRHWSPATIEVTESDSLYRATATVGPTATARSCTGDWQQTKKAAEEEACSRLLQLIDATPPTAAQLAADEALRAAIRNPPSYDAMRALVDAHRTHASLPVLAEARNLRERLRTRRGDRRTSGAEPAVAPLASHAHVPPSTVQLAALPPPRASFALPQPQASCLPSVPPQDSKGGEGDGMGAGALAALQALVAACTASRRTAMSCARHCAPLRIRRWRGTAW